MSIFRKGLNRRLFARGYRLVRTRTPDWFELMLLKYLERNERSLRFVQIGANDGKRFDPIFEFASSSAFNFSGIAVEPVPRFYGALQETYRYHPNIKAINLAIHNEISEATLYVVGEAYENKVPEWALGTASFDKLHVIKPEVPESYIEAIQVPCKSLSDVVKQEGFEDLDLLQIDTEGYDGEIIRGIDFSQTKPSIIHFEHSMQHDVMSKAELDDLIVLLNKHGYQVLIEEFDVLAYLPYKV